VKNLDRLELIDRIGRELQVRMSYVDIRVYLKTLGVDITKPTSGVNSKWIYAKELLADVPAETVVRIADELELPHTYVVTTDKATVEATFWEPQHFRLFLSHLSTFKERTGTLQAALRQFGISAFVAHVDIEPTRDWLREIETGLSSMDALAAILMPGFKESSWADQETGIAVGRGVLVIPIIRGLNPYGFIAKFQGLQAMGKTVAQVAQEVFDILIASPQTRSRMLACLVDTTLRSNQQDDAVRKLNRLAAVRDLPSSYLERLREGAATAASFAEGPALEKLNQLLLERGLPRVITQDSNELSADEEIPF
jgi:hypothetical protein